MTSASSLAFPNSRTVANWWRQLAPFEPQGLCVGYLFLHRLEAPACWLQAQPLAPFLLLLLEALVVEQPGANSRLSCSRLQHRLNLDMPILRRLLQSLAALRLITSEPSGTDLNCSWVLTEQGQEALRTKNVWSRRWQRGMFPFVERLGPTGRRLAPPHYLNVQEAPSSTWLVDESALFDMSWLHDSVNQSAEWKKTFGFPVELAAFPALAPEPGEPLSWDRIVLDRTERLVAVLFHSRKPQEELLGFGVRPEGWVLRTAEPILRMPAGAAIFPEMEQPTDLEVWQQAWRSWRDIRTVPEDDLKECSLAVVGERLRVAAPERLIRYLQSSKSAIFNEETWILAGEGYLRRATRLEVVPK